MGESGSGQNHSAEHPCRAGQAHQRRGASFGREYHQNQGQQNVRSSGVSIWASCSRISTCWIPFQPAGQYLSSAGALAQGATLKWPPALQPIARQLGIEALLDKYPYEVSGGQKAARSRGPRADHKARRLCWRTSLQARWIPRRPHSLLRTVRRDQPRRPDHLDGDALHAGGQPCGPCAVHQGRRGVPSALPRRYDKRRDVSAKIGDTLTMLTTGGADRGVTLLYPKLALTNLGKNNTAPTFPICSPVSYAVA